MKRLLNYLILWNIRHSFIWWRRTRKLVHPSPYEMWNKPIFIGVWKVILADANDCFITFVSAELKTVGLFSLKQQSFQFRVFYAPPPESGGVLCYTLRNFECPSVCLSVSPSVRPSAPTTILVSATPPTVLGQSFWNFTGVLRMVWRYAYCFFRILKLFFITFFPFLT